MASLLSWARAWWQGLRRPAQHDVDMDDEMRFHIEMEAQRLARQQGVDAPEARRRAMLAFGGVEKYRGAGRDALRLTWARGLSTDLKLGTRMLVKYPGLTAVAVFALALAIGAGAAYLEFVNDLLHGRLPFPDAERIVGIQTWDQQAGEPENRVTADFVDWRATLASFEDLGAHRALDRTLVTEDGRAEPVRGVEISSSVFRLARVPPLMGRPLVPDDERAAAPPVAVIGHDLWTTRFASDPDVVGRTIRLGSQSYTVVGVMPDGFGFPVSHSLWVPLRLSDAHYARREGAELKLFGRLAPGVTLREAQAELTTVAQRAAAAFPATHRSLQPLVKPYVESIWSTVQDSAMQHFVFYAANFLFLGLLGVCGANIATLVFARTATRDTEISVRTALGASRARIAGQLFAEAIVLSTVAAGVGLVVAIYGLRWVKRTVIIGMGEPLMFWWDDRLSPLTMTYAAVLTIGAALIVGVVPALKATGPRVQERLRRASGGSASGLRFGGVWTGVIVAQVSLTVIFLAIAGTLSWGRYFSNGGNSELAFPASQYLAMRLAMDREIPGDAERVAADARHRALLRARYQELADRLAAEPGIAGVTFATRLPGLGASMLRIELEGEGVAPGAATGTTIRTASIGVGFVETFRASIVAGRSFSDVDLAPGRHVAIVDQTFARLLLRGQEPIGRQFRELGEVGSAPGPWTEIVGVVADLTLRPHKGVADAVVYRPAQADVAMSLQVAVHVNGDPTAMMSRLRIVAAGVDPLLRIDDLQSFEQVSEADQVTLAFFAQMVSGAGIVALVLATAGVYALMSFTVARRTAEIGIRIALGANPRRIVGATFARALAQVALGVLVGCVPAGYIVVNLAPGVSTASGPTVAVTTCLLVAVFMGVVTVLACVIPARHALKIEPTAALKAT